MGGEREGRGREGRGEKKMAGKAQAKAKARLKVADRTPKMQSLLRARLQRASSLEEALTYVMDALERVRVARAAGWERPPDTGVLGGPRPELIVPLRIQPPGPTFASLPACTPDPLENAT